MRDAGGVSGHKSLTAEQMNPEGRGTGGKNCPYAGTAGGKRRRAGEAFCLGRI